MLATTTQKSAGNGKDPLSPYTDNDKPTLSVSSPDSHTPILLHPRWSASLQHLKTLSDSPRVIQGMSVRHCRWACQWPIGLAQRATVCGYLSCNPICVAACVYIRRHPVWPMQVVSLVDDFIWVGHRVGHWCILTVNLLSEILRIALIEVTGWYIRKASNPLSGHQLLSQIMC